MAVEDVYLPVDARNVQFLIIGRKAGGRHDVRFADIVSLQIGPRLRVHQGWHPVPLGHQPALVRGEGHIAMRRPEFESICVEQIAEMLVMLLRNTVRGIMIFRVARDQETVGRGKPDFDFSGASII